MVKRYLNEKGFTLVELMTVVIIIAVLILIAIPVYHYTKTNSEEKTCQANQRIIEGAAVMWVMDEPGRKTDDATLADLKTYWKDDPAPLCPLGNKPYELDKGRVTCPYHVHPHY